MDAYQRRTVRDKTSHVYGTEFQSGTSDNDFFPFETFKMVYTFDMTATIIVHNIFPLQGIGFL